METQEDYGQYVIINTDLGIIQWYEKYDSAMQALPETGGSILNTATADPKYVKRCLDAARKNM